MKKSLFVKFLSTCLIVALMIGVSAPVFAASRISEDYDYSTSIEVDGETVDVHYSISGNYITEAKVGDDTFERQGNSIFMNGEKIATITTTVTYTSGDSIEPRSGWFYSDTCPYGTVSSDYNTLETTKWHNITLEDRVVKYSVVTLQTLLSLAFPVDPALSAAKVFGEIAKAIFEQALQDGDFSNSTVLYANETIFKGPIPYTRKNIFDFFETTATSSRYYCQTRYSSWA